MDVGVLVLLVLAALVAGFLDSIVGGGGVITLPALLAAGLPPHVAVATNKVVGTGASSIATINYARAGLIHDRRAWWIAPIAGAAGALGAVVVLRIPEHLILRAVMTLMVVLTAYVLMRPRFGTQDRTRHSTGAWLAMGGLAILIGFYDGLLGPGTGNLLLFAFVAVAGMPFLQAAAHGRLINLASNVGALTYFALAGPIDWLVGPVMAIGTVAGGFLGSTSNIRSGAKWVRPLFVLVAIGLLVRLVWA